MYIKKKEKKRKREREKEKKGNIFFVIKEMYILLHQNYKRERREMGSSQANI